MVVFSLLLSVFCLSVALLWFRHCRRSSRFYRLKNLPSSLVAQAE